jgi:hypothetical protein
MGGARETEAEQGIEMGWFLFLFGISLVNVGIGMLLGLI